MTFDAVASQNFYWVEAFVLMCCFAFAAARATTTGARHIAIGCLLREMGMMVRIGAWFWAVVLAPDGISLVCEALGAEHETGKGFPASAGSAWLSGDGQSAICAFKSLPYADWIWDVRPWLLVAVAEAVIGGLLVLGHMFAWRARGYVSATVIAALGFIVAGFV